MTRRVLLHVGTPKTGTSYVQDVLFRNTEPLAAAGIRYPADRFDLFRDLFLLGRAAGGELPSKLMRHALSWRTLRHRAGCAPAL
jgi:hypothetical protein